MLCALCCERISLLHSSRALSCEQKLCEPISLLYFLRSLSCEQKLSEPISLSLSPHLSLAHRLGGSQAPCSARNAVARLHHFMLPCPWLQCVKSCLIPTTTQFCHICTMVIISALYTHKIENVVQTTRTRRRMKTTQYP